VPAAPRPTRTPIGSTVLGYPRIGPNRELKRALESYWAGHINREELEKTAAQLRADTWQELADAGLGQLPSNTFSYYDQMLDTAVLVGAIPQRYRDLGGDPLDTYFAAARGQGGVGPLEMTKWFDTNYHYLVPEIGPDTAFRLDAAKPLAEIAEALALGHSTRPVIIGPATFLLLAKPVDAPEGFTPFDRLDDLLPVYEELLGRFAEAGAEWVQLDEPAFVTDRSDDEIAALGRAYRRLTAVEHRPAILAASYFGHLGPALPALVAAGVEGVAVDLVSGSGTDPLSGISGLVGVPGLANITVAAGIVDGRNVWRTDLEPALRFLGVLLGLAGEVAVSTSCSLLHVPYDVGAETGLDADLRSWLSFARQKVDEVVTLARGLKEGRPAVAAEIATATGLLASRAASPAVVNPAVRDRAAAVTPADQRRGPYAARAAAQKARLDLPRLPTTTIGSFPQTAAVRLARADLRAGRIDEAAYRARMEAEIERVIRLQEQLGLDVLVHGEPERNDMVQYFAEHLDGFASTARGWVQSYGSRCVRPPILFGDVSRPRPITVSWWEYAQSLTGRPVKGMLTGPVTILAWSFVRDDQPLDATARQVALAIRDEAGDLERAGAAIIQVDEPALRELLPLRTADQPDYLEWSVGAFRLATSGVADNTQIHTHLCYSEFGQILDAIDGLDADVTSIEAARSHMEVIPQIAASGFARGIGPGVYDIHSPRVPTADEIESLLLTALTAVPTLRLWVNPDCGLKTRSYREVKPALQAMVEAAIRVGG
jgi:5-methyltetrahydropteroyltriglutamate--homocysteine methyltransferase